MYTLLTSEEQLRLLLDANPDAVILKDGEGRWVLANDYALRLFCLEGVPYKNKKNEELANLSRINRMIFANFGSFDEQVWLSGSIIRTEQILPQPDGVNKILEVIKTPVFTSVGSRVGLLIILRDLTESKSMEEELKLVGKVFESSSDGIIITDTRGVIQSVNHTFTRVTGYTGKEAIGRTPRMLKSGRQSQAFYRNMWSTLLKTGNWQGEIWNRRKSGEIYPEWLNIDTIKNEKGVITHYIAVFMDITEKEQLKKELILTGKIQAELLPPDFENAAATVRTIYQPYRYVSGDLYDYKWRKENTILFGYLMDVMGHGLATALQTSALRVLFHQILQSDCSLTDKLFYINNEALRFFTDDTFAAAICFEFDFEKQTLTYASAGINYFIASTEGLIKVEGSFLGMTENVYYEQHVLNFKAGDCFYFMTDGLFDALPESFPCTDSFERAFNDLYKYATSKDCKDDATAICLKVNDNDGVLRSG